MNESATARPTRVQEHLLALKAQRYEEIVATIPRAIPAVLRDAYEAYVHLAVMHHGKRGLARVHWPWNEEAIETRVPRGRLTNPTAIR